MSPSIRIGNEVIEASVGKTIEESVRDAGRLPDAYLFVVDGRPVPMDTPITDGMTVKAIKVASGG
ncbi:MAG: hypothetical protein MJZ38_05470 [archaeon]|nr:hypothetical protein [archaeon]